MVLLGSDRLSAMRSPDRRLTGNLMAIGLAGMSLAGMPPTAGFVAKWWLVKAALETGQWWWAIAIAAGGLLTAAYVTRILRAGFASAAEAEDRTARSGELPWSMTLAPWVLAAAALLLGFLGSWFGPLVLRGTQWAPTS